MELEKKAGAGLLLFGAFVLFEWELGSRDEVCVDFSGGRLWAGPSPWWPFSGVSFVTMRCWPKRERESARREATGEQTKPT